MVGKSIWKLNITLVFTSKLLPQSIITHVHKRNVQFVRPNHVHVMFIVLVQFVRHKNVFVIFIVLHICIYFLMYQTISVIDET